MKSLIGLVLLALLAVLSAMLLKERSARSCSWCRPTGGPVGGLFLLIVLIVLWLTFWLGRVLQRLRVSERVRIYRERRTELGAHRRCTSAARAAGGPFVRAERSAQDAQAAPLWPAWRR